MISLFEVIGDQMVGGSGVGMRLIISRNTKALFQGRRLSPLAKNKK